MLTRFGKSLTNFLSPLPDPVAVAREGLHIARLRELDALADLEAAEERVAKLRRRIARLEAYLGPGVRELR